MLNGNSFTESYPEPISLEGSLIRDCLDILTAHLGEERAEKVIKEYLSKNRKTPGEFTLDSLYSFILSLAELMGEDIQNRAFSELAGDLIHLAQTYEKPLIDGGNISDYLYRKEEGDKIRVMVIDDSAADSLSLSRFLDGTRFELVGEAEDGVEGVKMFLDLKKKGLTPHVVFVNLIMPKMNGVDVTRTIKAVEKDTQIIGISTINHPAHIEKMFEAGVSAYLIKPLKRRMVINTLNDILEERR